MIRKEKAIKYLLRLGWRNDPRPKEIKDWYALVDKVMFEPRPVDKVYDILMEARAVAPEEGLQLPVPEVLVELLGGTNGLE